MDKTKPCAQIAINCKDAEKMALGRVTNICSSNLKADDQTDNEVHDNIKKDKRDKHGKGKTKIILYHAIKHIKMV